MSGHTPGPWELDQYPDVDGYKIRGGKTAFRSGPRVLAIVKDQGSAPLYESQANARLIAAAPDLLEALKKIYGFEPFALGLTPTEYQEAVDKIAINAIAKAEGQP
jgi:hypothetical protein